MAKSGWMMVVLVIEAACGPGGVADDDQGGDGSGTESTGVSSASGNDGTGPTDATAADASTSVGDASSADETGASGDTASADTGSSSCPAETFSDLPGVTLDVATGECVYTLAEAQAGVLTTHTLAIEQALAEVDSGDDCHETPIGSLLVTWRVYGGEHVHCNCDVGLCAPYVPMPTTLVVGSEDEDFTWHAFDWSGRSDTNNPFGPAFPPGEYIVEVRASGSWNDPVAGPTPFEAWARQPVTLVE